MGQVSTEQTVAIIDSVANALNHPDPVIQVIQPAQNYWWLLLIAIIPTVLGGLHLKKRKKSSGKR